MQNAKLRIAQIDCTLANFDENLARHCTLAEEAIRDGADAIAFPELSLTGYNGRVAVAGRHAQGTRHQHNKQLCALMGKQVGYRNVPEILTDGHTDSAKSF